ncbi:MAG: hypothetical protein FWD89_04505 [Firmicutes bacterium]|nr:hypothetical protein [Bacillota bacterium]
MIKRPIKCALKGQPKELRIVIETLKSTGAFQVRGSKVPVSEHSKIDDKLSIYASRIDSALSTIKESYAAAPKAVKKMLKKEPGNKEFEAIDVEEPKARDIEATYAEIKAYADKEKNVGLILSKVEKNAVRQKEIEVLIKKNMIEIKELEGYSNFPLEASSLQNTKEAFVLVGNITDENLEIFKGDYDTESLVIEKVELAKDKTCCVVIGSNVDMQLAEQIYNYGFTTINLNFPFNESPVKRIEKLNKEIAELEMEAFNCLIGNCLEEEEILELKQFYDYAQNEIDTERLIKSTLVTKDYFVLNGWVLKDKEEDVVAQVSKVAPNTEIKIRNIVRTDKVPIIVKNSGIIEPYQGVTNMFGAPGQKDIDPNPFVAIFYFIFFGFMIGDIGYGLLMLVAGLGFVFWKKPKNKGTRGLILLIAMGGLSGMIWGTIYGSIFGLEFGLQAIDPIGNAILLLFLAIGLGIIHLSFGVILKFANLIKQGRVLEAICDPMFRFLFFIGIVFVALPIVPDFVQGLYLNVPDVFSTIGLVLIGVGVAGTAIGAAIIKQGIVKRLIGAFASVYSFVNYISDILSYARLFALALVGAVIGLVANIMAEMLFEIDIPVIGHIAGFTVAILFHMFNLALGVLGAYIHNSRLQFVEFFGKFYEGDGQNFAAEGSDVMKYVSLVPSEFTYDIPEEVKNS